MRFYYPPVSVAVILLACHVSWTCCTTVEFYSERNYSGFIEKKVLSEKDERACIELNSPLEIRSVKTDKCVMLYETKDCRRQSKVGYNDALYTIRVEKNTKHFPTNEQIYPKRDDERIVGSFHVCGSMGGGATLDVDIYPEDNYRGSLVKGWKGVCKCENIPRAMSLVLGSELPFSIDNHGNAVHVYNQEHCRGNSTFLPAGDSRASRHVLSEKSFYFFSSFRPSSKLNCIKLDASIYKFTFSNGSLPLGYKEENVELASTQTLINDGVRSMKQAVQFSKTTVNTVEYSVAQAFTHINSTNVTSGVEADASLAFSWLGGKLKYDLLKNYSSTNSKMETSLNHTSVAESETLKITTTVTVNACEKCHVTGYIKMVRDFPISYTAEALVTGMAGDEKMSAEEIQRYLPAGMEYVKDFDDDKVQVSVEGKMRADFAWETFVSKTCERLPSCQHDDKRGHLLGASGKTHESYAVPFVVVEMDNKLRYSGGEGFQIGMPIGTPGEFRESALSESTLF